MSDKKTLPKRINDLYAVIQKIQEVPLGSEAKVLNLSPEFSSVLGQKLEKLTEDATAFLSDFNEAVKETGETLKQELSERFEGLLQSPEKLVSYIKENPTKTYKELQKLPEALFDDVLETEGAFLALCNDENLSIEKKYKRAEFLFSMAGDEQQIKLIGTDGVIPLLCLRGSGFEAYTRQFLDLQIETKEKVVQDMFVQDIDALNRVFFTAIYEETFQQDLNNVINRLAEKDPFPWCKLTIEDNGHLLRRCGIFKKDWFNRLSQEQRQELSELDKDDILKGFVFRSGGYAAWLAGEPKLPADACTL